MKKIETFSYQKKKYHSRFSLMVLLIMLMFYGTAQARSEFSELISLNIKNAPLAEVLDNVSQASGYEFIIDENWHDLPITVKFEAIPLEEALNRILANVNHAIVYRSDRKVLIRIYENESSGSRHGSAGMINQNPPEPPFQSQEIELPTSPNPLPPEPATAEVESEDSQSDDSDMTSPQPEGPGEESQDKDDAESPDESSEAQDNG